MYSLYYHPVCPFSRKVRLHLAAKNIEFELVLENFWQRRKEFLAISPSSRAPVLTDSANDVAICGGHVIAEYIEEKDNIGRNFIGDDLIQRAEVRRLQSWFDDKFYREVVKFILNERFFYRYFSLSKAPDTEVLRFACKNAESHFEYIEKLLESRKYLAGDLVSLADFTAVAQISLLDYFGDVNWSHYQAMKEWYSVIKSQKIFAPLLRDRLTNIRPCEGYSNLDF